MEKKLDNKAENKPQNRLAYYHLPGLFEFYDLYEIFLKIYREHRDYFYEWCEIGSIYGAPYDCIWGGGRVGYGENNIEDVIKLVKEYNITPRLTFSNSLLRREHLEDKKCNEVCRVFNEAAETGVIIYSDMLLKHIKNNYKNTHFISTTTKVITDFDEFVKELNREEFRYVVPDFRLNKRLERLRDLSDDLKDKVEFLCNECCSYLCKDRKACYENVSHKVLGDDVEEHKCTAIDGNEGYVFSKAKRNPGFIGIEDIKNIYLPMGYSNFKIEGRSLGSALILEFLLYYMTKPEYQLNVREEIYLDASLDLF